MFMVKKGRPAKYELTYEQKIWDNYNPYNPPKEASDKELMTHKQELAFNRLVKGYTELAKLAGYEEVPKSFITLLVKRVLAKV